MNLEQYFQERTEQLKTIAVFICSVVNGCEIIEVKDKRKNRTGLTSRIKFSYELAEKMGDEECYCDDLNFDIDWFRLWALVETIESLGYELILTPKKCNWLNNNGDWLFDESFEGHFPEATRINFVYDACVAFINDYKIN